MQTTSEGYRVVYEGGESEITEKKSRFIATVRPVESEEEATTFIAEMKKKYWDARHNCSAFVIGERQELTRCSDDGEPAQTAGRPMLDVLLKEGITNVAVVVTRYFGGVLLGTGGLVRIRRRHRQDLRQVISSRNEEDRSFWFTLTTMDSASFNICSDSSRPQSCLPNMRRMLH